MLVCYAVVFGWFLFSQAWNLSEGNLFSRHPGAYYHHATDAMLAGRAHLAIVPRPELAQLSDPYNSALNTPYRELDLSYYRGRYYFYWGMAPVVLFFAPCRAILGLYPSEALGSAAFAYCALLIAALLLLRIRRAHFPHLGRVATALILAATGVCSLLASMPSASVYNVAIAAAAFGQAGAFYCLYRGLHDTPHKVRWFALLGVAASCSIASRPNYVLWIWILGVPLVLLALKHRGNALRWPLYAALAPVVAGLAMLAFNYVRFGDLAEFGMHYQLTGPLQPKVLFSFSNIVSNLGMYGWNLPHVSPLFPYVYVPARGPFGVASFPLVFAGVGLLFLPRSLPLRATAWAIAACGVGGLLATCAFFGCGMRYMVDFAPASLVAASIGAMALAQCGVASRTAGFAVVSSAAVSLAVGALLQMPAWNQGRELGFQARRILDRPYYWLSKDKARDLGPLKVVFSMPTGRNGAFEPLLSTGDRRRGGEVVFLNYVDEKHVRIGFFQTGTTHWLSAPLPVDYTSEHELLVFLGSLLPGGTHPVFDSWPEREREQALSDAILVLDGKRVYESSLRFAEESRTPAWLGKNETEGGVSEYSFSGTLRTSSTPLSRLSASDYGKLASTGKPVRHFGSCRLRVRFPEKPPIGSYEPLLVSGVTGKGDFVYVFYPEKDKIAFGHDCWGVGGSSSASVSIDPGVEHLIEIDHSGLHDRSNFEAGRLFRDAPFVRVRLNGVVVFDAADRLYESDPETVTIGENRLGGSTTAPRFTGEILSAETVQDP